MKLFNRTLELQGDPQNPRKVWTYLDETEHLFAFEMWSMAGFAVENLDTFMERDTLPQDLRDELLEYRRAALHDYAQGRFDMAVLRLAVLNSECRRHGLLIGMNPLLRKIRKAENDARDAGIKSGQARQSLPSSIDLNQMRAEMLDKGVKERNVTSILAKKYGCGYENMRLALRKPK